MTPEALLEARVWPRVDRSDPDACWIWPGTTSSGYASVGYGPRGAERRFLVTHLLLDVPPGWVRRHTCDVRRCVNPRHIVPGTRQQNSRDMVERGRSLRGERSPTAKLTDLQAVLIRLRLSYGETGRALAREFGVSEATVSFIRRRRAWAHV